MPQSVQAKLSELMQSGLDVYPPGMRGLAAQGGRRRGGIMRGRERKPVPDASGKKFIAWVRASHPKLFAAAQRRAANEAAGVAGLASLGQDAPAATAGPVSRFISTITAIAPQYLQYKAQKDLLQIQLDRAARGMPPLDATQYAPGVQVSLDPSMYTPQLDALKPWLLVGGIALAAVFVLPRLLGGRRR